MLALLLLDHPALLCTTTGLHRWHHSHALSAMVELTIVPKLDVMNDDSDNLRAVSSEHGLAAAPSPAKEDRSRLSDKLSVQMPRVRSRSRSRVRPPSIDEDDQDDELLAADDEKELPVREFFRCGVQSADETEWICGVDNDLFPFIDDEPLDVAETAVAIVPQSGLSRNSDSLSVHSLAAQHPLELARELSKEPSIAPSDGERQSIMKTLRDLWGPTTLSVQPGQATSLLGGEISLLFDFVGFRPLDYPLYVGKRVWACARAYFICS